MAKNARSILNKQVTSNRRNTTEEVSLSGVKDSSARLYELNWALFKNLGMDPELKEGNGVLDPDDFSQPNAECLINLADLFYYKVVENN